MSSFHVPKPSSQHLFGALILAGLSACGGGGDGDASPSVAPTPVSPPVVPQSVPPISFVGKADKSYEQIQSSSGAKVEVFRSASGSAAQSLYVNPKTGERVRVFNGSDGLPERILDEVNGRAMTINRRGTDRIDYLSYDASGAYLGGYAVLITAAGLKAAPITGTPSVAGQLSAQMEGLTQTGSFALLPAADAGLGTAVPFSAAVLAYVDALPPLAATVSPMAAGPRTSAAAGIDRRALLGGLAMGVAVGIGSGAVPALVAGAMVAWGLQNIGLPIADGVSNASTIEQMSDNLNTFLDRFSRGASAETILGNSLAGQISARLSGAVQRGFDTARDVAGNLVDRVGQPALTALPPPTDTPVSGYGVDQAGTNYSVSGSVAGDGGLTAVATADIGGDTVKIKGSVTGGNVAGTISGRLGDGTLSGSVTQLGQCATLQQSGGQGTFSYVFDAGIGSGSLTFYRNAYTIPDGFRVISNGKALYDTGGLVKGSDSVQLVLNGSRTLFVNVNAPNSGTAWELNVGCPS